MKSTVARMALAILSVALLSSCSPLEADTKRIQQLWRGYSDASMRGLDHFFSYMAANNYPGAGCTEEAYRATYRHPPDYEAEAIVLVDTVEPDPEWTMIGGLEADSVPEGRLYIHQLIVSRSSESQGWSAEEQRVEAHATTIDDAAYFFISCDIPPDATDAGSVDILCFDATTETIEALHELIERLDDDPNGVLGDLSVEDTAYEIGVRLGRGCGVEGSGDAISEVLFYLTLEAAARPPRTQAFVNGLISGICSDGFEELPLSGQAACLSSGT